MKQPGYILMLSLIIVATLMILVTTVATQVMVARQTAMLVRDREQARVLALSGIQIALAQLYEKTEKSSELKSNLAQSATATKASGENVKQDYAQNLFAISDYWQEYELNEEVEGVEGSIKLYVAPEDGKLNLNTLWDYKNKKFVTTPKAREILMIIQEKFNALWGTFSFVEPLEQFLKKRDEPLDDLTQLKTIKEFEKLLPYFFEKLPEKDHKVIPAITDLFTLSDKNTTISAATLSLSMQWLLGIDQQDSKTIKKLRKELAPKLVRAPQQMETQWDNNLQPLYRKPFAKISVEFKPLMNAKFEGNFFSVVSYGKTKKITQKIYALIERVELDDQKVHYITRKLYWI